MKGLLICNKGIEDAALLELKELIKVDGKLGDTVIEFSCKEKDLVKLAYFTQSANRVIEVLKVDKIKKVDDINFDVDLSRFLDKVETFGLECVRVGGQDFKSVDVEAKLIKIIGEAYEKKFTHDNADVEFFAYVHNEDFYFGIQYGGDLSKRDYKIFSTKNSLKGPVGYGLVRDVGFSKKEKLVVTSSHDGVIGIEGALYSSGKSVHFFSKQKFLKDEEFLVGLDRKEVKSNIVALDASNHNLTQTKKNAKIAGVEKLMSFSRMELQWLDTKFDKASVDRVIGHLPSISKHREEKAVKKIYKEFFYQTSYILKKKGSILTLTHRRDLLEDAAKEYKLKKIKEKTIAQGQVEFVVMVFTFS